MMQEVIKEKKKHSGGHIYVNKNSRVQIQRLIRTREHEQKCGSPVFVYELQSKESPGSIITPW